MNESTGAARHDGEQFISEPIDPERGSFSTGLMSEGLASLPLAFVWRNRRYQIVECLEHTKVSSPEGGVASNERYLRRQEFTVRLDSGAIARIYVQRQAARGASRQSAKKRWFLYSLASSEETRSDHSSTNARDLELPKDTRL